MPARNEVACVVILGGSQLSCPSRIAALPPLNALAHKCAASGASVVAVASGVKMQSLSMKFALPAARPTRVNLHNET